MSEIKYSIVTVCLNSEKTIERCLQSVKKQKYDNYEHIIIDGLSSDKTLDIISKFDISKLISEKDHGIYDAMNKGASLAKGKYILFLNSDDELDSDYFQECELKVEDADFISVGINMIYENKTTFWRPDPNALVDSFKWRMPLPHPGLAVKRTIFNELKGFDSNFKIAADYDFIVRLLKITKKGILLNKPLVKFYVGGISNNKKILYENNIVRSKNYKNKFFIYSAYLLDQLRWLKNS